MAAEDAAQAAGVDLSLYRHRVLVLPRHNDLPDCSWAGVANVGCSSFCRAWIAEGESPMVFAHELGHNLNLAHAGTVVVIVAIAPDTMAKTWSISI